MRVEYINPFVEGALSVLHEVLDADVRRGELSLKSGSQPLLAVTTMVGLSGSLAGRVLFEMAKDTALSVVAVMNGEEFDRFDQLAFATVTELSNMMTGRAVTELHRLGFSFGVTPPTLITGKDMEAVTGPLDEALVVPFETPWGTLQVNIFLEERSA